MNMLTAMTGSLEDDVADEGLQTLIVRPSKLFMSVCIRVGDILAAVSQSSASGNTTAYILSTIQLIASAARPEARGSLIAC